LMMEKDEYKEFLNPDKMEYGDAINKKRLRLTVHRDIENKYENSCMQGFDFTSHDVLQDIELRENYRRRYRTLLSLHEKKVNIFYHHRICSSTDKKMLIKHLLELKKIYVARSCDVNVIMFTQVIVKDANQRKILHYSIDGIHVYVFYTLNIWAGVNHWAAEEDFDLTKTMIDDVVSGFSSKNSSDLLVYSEGDFQE